MGLLVSSKYFNVRFWEPRKHNCRWKLTFNRQLSLFRVGAELVVPEKEFCSAPPGSLLRFSMSSSMVDDRRLWDQVNNEMRVAWIHLIILS